MIKPFLTEEVKNTIMFHRSFESFHKYVDKEILPGELGGMQGSFENTDTWSAISIMAEYFVQVQNYVKENSNL